MAYTPEAVGILQALSRFNAAHPWSHNAAFTPLIRRHARDVARRGGRRALDVGCGTGELVATLAGELPDVLGLEPDPTTARMAQRHIAGIDGARIEQHPFDDRWQFDKSEQSEHFDLIVFVASLHHMPLEPTLRAARNALAPGGRLVVVGVCKDTAADLPRDLASLVLNPIIGLVRHPKPAASTPVSMRAPTAEASETFDQIGAVARRLMPGIRLRRRLFWRYTAIWTRPLAPPVPSH